MLISAVLLLEVNHEVAQSNDAFFRHGVVDGRAAAADGAVSLQRTHSKSLGVFHKLLLQILGGKAEGSGKKDEANPLASLLGGKTDGNLLSALLGGKTGGLTRMAEEDGTGDAPEEGGILKLIPDEGKE